MEVTNQAPVYLFFFVTWTEKGSQHIGSPSNWAPTVFKWHMYMGNWGYNPYTLDFQIPPQAFFLYIFRGSQDLLSFGGPGCHPG